MRFIHSRYYARQLQDRTTDLLLRRLQLPDYSSHCTATTLIRSLLLAAVAAVSIAAVVTLRSRRPFARNLAQGRISDVAGLRAPPTSHSRVAPCRLAPVGSVGWLADNEVPRSVDAFRLPSTCMARSITNATSRRPNMPARANGSEAPTMAIAMAPLPCC